ncbi:CheR family methyltransferase [Uliginosibacterium gangwonense]|uniref:CheR family methyltransferase n=1 Tax=Uliginosibacterium gangwonense TaxID=392736 RepID=UPI000369B1FA|nr:protein-glutamate O-methyltransferase [Uliginosibacterium gangwonense]
MAGSKTMETTGGQISDKDFALFQRLIFSLTGIHLASAKKPMLCGRLGKRLRALGLSSYQDYYELISSAKASEERETCINLITTNETYFFREPRHFDFLRQHVLPQFRTSPLRVWSAACSSGEEVYTLALVLAETLGLGKNWEVFGSDISTHVLQKAAQAIYPMDRGEKIPKHIMHKYCLKGKGENAGLFAIDQALRKHVRFGQINLNTPLPDIGDFDVVFLRNVMIYFPVETKAAVVERLAERIKPGGWLFIGHSETLNGVTEVVRQISPTIYRKTRE